jgi:hypothetical protein
MSFQGMGDLSSDGALQSNPGSRMDSAPRLIGMMSLSRLFLGRLRSRRARLRFTGQAQNALQ